LPSKGETADEYRRWDEKGRKWLYGYVWFQQRKDKSIVRGYMQVRFMKNPLWPGNAYNPFTVTHHPQRSIVILSHLAYPALFDAVLEKVAPIYFSHGYSALEAACHGIAGWYVNGTTLPSRPKTYMSMYRFDQARPRPWRYVGTSAIVGSPECRVAGIERVGANAEQARDSENSRRSGEIVACTATTSYILNLLFRQDPGFPAIRCAS
jgi:hypothetical protein